MSNSLSTGYYFNQQHLTQRELCLKGKDGEHKWKILGTWPSTWQKCIHCELTTYSK